MNPARDPVPYDTATGAPRQVVASPEQVMLEFPVAGPSVRMLAYCIDLVLVLIAQISLFIGLMAAGPLTGWIGDLFRQVVADAASGDPTSVQRSSAMLFLIAIFLVLQLVTEWSYFICVEFVTGGRSLGKAIMRLRVLRDDGLPITLRDCGVRNLLRAVDMLPSAYLLGLIAMLASPYGKRLGDLAAGTVVIRLDLPEPALPIALPDAGASAFRFDREQIGRMGPVERQLLRQTLRRLETLTSEQKRDALERTTLALCRRLGYPPVEPAERDAFLRALLRAIETA